MRLRDLRLGGALALVVAASACTRPATPPREPAERTDILLGRDSEVIEARVPRDATLSGILRAHQVSEDLAARMVEAVRDAFDPRRLRAEQPYRLERTGDGSIREFVYKIDADRFLRIVGLEGEEAEPRFDAEVLPYEKQYATAAVRGAIDRERPSLVAALARHGENVMLAMEMADVLGGEVDFNNDLQPGDAFEVVFTKHVSEGEVAGYGPVIAAELQNAGRTIRAFRFQPEGGEAGYYDEHGRSMKRFFLRSPLQFEPRISSGFTYRRLHPILGVWRSHPAIDYVAPTGAPVVAVASGVVVSAGWAGGGGRTVVLRHNNGYESSYMHLSAFGRGVAPGARVAQGQVIGRVGETGLATAPHLDYRLKRNGAFVNPLVEHERLPPGEPVPAAQLAAFERARDRAAGMFVGPPAEVAVAGREAAADTSGTRAN